jgi:hypothetical protein
MKKLLLMATIIALVGFSGCSKKEMALLEQDLMEAQNESESTADLADAEGWKAMNEFREKKNLQKGQADISIQRGLWLMETTLNYDHGHIKEEEFTIIGEDELEFSIPVHPKTGRLIGGKLLSEYVRLEKSIAKFDVQNQLLLLADIEFVEIKNKSEAIFRIIRIIAEKRSFERGPEKGYRSIDPGYCHDSSTNTEAWQMISNYLRIPTPAIIIGIGETSYISEIGYLVYRDGMPLIPTGFFWRGTNRNECIDVFGHYLPNANAKIKEVADQLELPYLVSSASMFYNYQLINPDQFPSVYDHFHVLRINIGRWNNSEY